MATNNSKYSYFGIVINAPKEKATHDQENDFFNGILDHLQDYNKIKFFASAIHDLDTHENGERKRTHLHIAIETYQKSTILGVLKDFTNTLDIDKGLVSLDGSNNLSLLVQYLTHKNQPQKHQYDTSIIRTSNKELFENLNNEQYQDPDLLISNALLNCSNAKDLMKALGPEKARKFLSLFNQIKKDDQNDIEKRLAMYNHLHRKYQDLIEFNLSLFDTLKNGLTDHEKRLINLKEYESKFDIDFFNDL